MTLTEAVEAAIDTRAERRAAQGLAPHLDELAAARVLGALAQADTASPAAA